MELTTIFVIGMFVTFGALLFTGFPVAWVLAGTDTYLERDWFAAQAAAAGTDLELIDGGHFFLFTDVDRGVALIADRTGGAP